MSKPVFAVDVGGVLASKQHDGQPMDGVREGLLNLTPRFDLQVVSQCGAQRRLDTIDWLDAHGLAVFFSHQHYINFKHPNKNKVLKEIGAQYFVDDRIKHVRPALELGGMRKVFHLGTAEHPWEHPYIPNKYVWVQDWADLIEKTRGLR